MSFKETAPEWKDYRAKKSGIESMIGMKKSSSVKKSAIKKRSYYYDHLFYYIIEDLEYIQDHLYDIEGNVKEKYEQEEDKLACAIYDVQMYAKELKEKMEANNEPESE